MITAFILFGLGIALNAFFAGYETGFVATNRIRVRHMAEAEGDVRAARLLQYLVHPERMITVVLIGTNMALVMGTIALTREMEILVPGFGALYSTLIATPLFLIFGEVLPKSAFRLHPTRLSMALLPLIRFFDFVLAPVVVPVSWLSAKLVFMVEGEKAMEEVVMSSVEDMRVLVDESADRGTIEEDEKAMIHSVIDLQSRLAKEVMVPRINIVALPETASRSELIAKLVESGYTRLPVYRESIDTIVGVVNAFDVLRARERFDDLGGFIQDVLHIPDTMKLDDLLEAMREQGCPIAVVTDEHGGTDGILTQEDVLEEIFGEFHDEYDKAETSIREVSPGAYVVDAHMELEAAVEAMGVELEDEEVETVGGWVMHLVGRIPATGEVIRHGPYKITILEGSANSLSRLRIEITTKPSEV
jgi:putative hemolysin